MLHVKFFITNNHKPFEITLHLLQMKIEKKNTAQRWPSNINSKAGLNKLCSVETLPEKQKKLLLRTIGKKCLFIPIPRNFFYAGFTQKWSFVSQTIATQKRLHADIYLKINNLRVGTNLKRACKFLRVANGHLHFEHREHFWQPKQEKPAPFENHMSKYLLEKKTWITPDIVLWKTSQHCNSKNG